MKLDGVETMKLDGVVSFNRINRILSEESMYSLQVYRPSSRSRAAMRQEMCDQSTNAWHGLFQHVTE